MLIQTGTFYHNESNPSATTMGDVSTFRFISFPTPFLEGVVPVVIPFVQSFNGWHTPGIRIAEVNHLGFKFRFNEIPGHFNGPHVEETVGWIAFGPNPKLVDDDNWQYSH